MRIALLAVFLALPATAFAGASVERGTATITTRDGATLTLRVELARTAAARQQGLMNRRSLGAKAGMAFLYPESQRGGFWMKNTLIPLDIAFADARGRILRVLTMQPCRRDPCRIYDPNVAYRTALEVNAGSFRRWGVRAGDRLRIIHRADGQLQHVRPVVVARRVEALSRLQEHVRVELGVRSPPRRSSGPAR